MRHEKKKTVRICHLSDLHLPLTERVKPWELANKRLLGFLNLKLNRSKTYKAGAFFGLLKNVVQENADLVVITGDVSSLAFDFEFEEAGRLFFEAGLNPKNTVVIPGNHDRYTVCADLKGAFERGLASWLSSGFERDSSYPFVEEVGPVALIALDTAVWRNPFRAAGHIGRDQVERLVHVLDSDSKRGCWPVIAMHHPPFHLAKARLRDYRTGLDGSDELVQALKERGATILHGHLHKFSRLAMGDIEVFGVPAASNDAGDESIQQGYAVYTFDSKGLKQAQACRYWPGANDNEERIERFDFPLELKVG